MEVYNDLFLSDGERPNSYKVKCGSFASSHEKHKDIRERAKIGGDLHADIFIQKKLVDGKHQIIYLDVESDPPCEVLGSIDKKEKDIPDKTYKLAKEYTENMAKEFKSEFHDLTSKATLEEKVT